MLWLGSLASSQRIRKCFAGRTGESEYVEGDVVDDEADDWYDEERTKGHLGQVSMVRRSSGPCTYKEARNAMQERMKLRRDPAGLRHGVVDPSYYLQKASHRGCVPKTGDGDEVDNTEVRVGKRVSNGVS